MKKIILSAITASTMVFSLGYTDQPILENSPVAAEQIAGQETSNALSADAIDVPANTEEDEGTLVGHASNDGAKAARKKQWQNIALATSAVAIAVTALILVANNNGRSAHHHHH